jgi:zinc/manganese transport system permease protein
MRWAILLAVLIGIGATWLGVLLAYDSYYWGSARNGWPVSFFIVAIVFLTYLASGMPRLLSGRRGVSARLSNSLVGDPVDD